MSDKEQSDEDILNQIAQAGMDEEKISRILDNFDANEHSDKTMQDVSDEDNGSELVEYNEQPPADNPNKSEFENDFETARANLQELATQGSISLKQLMNIALASQHPRAFEVVSSLIKTLSNVNTELIELHEKRQQFTGNEEESEGSQIDQYYDQSNNVIFQGSTSEMMKKIREQRQSSQSDNEGEDDDTREQ